MTKLLGTARLLALGCLVMAPASAPAADLEVVATRLREAREKYTEMGQYWALYNTRTELAQNAKALQAQRDQQAIYLRNLRLQLDSFPARRNNIQEGVHQEWLQGRNDLIGLDSQLAVIQASFREVDEQSLALTAMNKKRVLPPNRRGIQAVFPVIRQECESSFRALQESADEFAGSSGISRDEALNRALPMLGRKDAVEAQYGPTRVFLADFKKFCNSKRLSEVPAKKGRR